MQAAERQGGLGVANAAERRGQEDSGNGMKVFRQAPEFLLAWLLPLTTVEAWGSMPLSVKCKIGMVCL